MPRSTWIGSELRGMGRGRGLARDAEQDEASNRPLTRAEQERGLRALEKLERLDRELLERRMRGRAPLHEA